MNLVKAQELAKELSIPELQQYANGSNPEMMPPYIALGALQAKESMQKKMAAMQGAAQGEQPSVKEQVEQKAGLMALQGQQQQQAQQQMMEQMQNRPMPAPEGIPQPNPQPQEVPMGMARGGLTRLPVNFNFKDGGIIGYAGPEGSLVGNELDAANAERQAALAELRKFGSLQKMQNPEAFAQAESAYQQADAQYKQLKASYEKEMSATPAGRPAFNVGDIGAASQQLGVQAPQQAPQMPQMPQMPPQAAPQAPQAMGAPPAGLPAAMPKPPPPMAAPMPQQPAPPVIEQPEVPQQSDQDRLIAEEMERRKAFGVEGEAGAGAESRMGERRKRFEETQPSGLDDLIRVFGQAGQYKGLSGMGPAYTANEDRKRAARAKFETGMEEQQSAIEEKRRAEGVGRATGIGTGLAGLREMQQKSEDSAARNLTLLEQSRIQAAAQNRPGETERLMAEYSRLKQTDPAAAEQFMQSIMQIKSGLPGGKGQMTRTQALDKVTKQMDNIVNMSQMKKEASAALNKKEPTFSEIQEYFIQQAMGGSENRATEPTAGTRLKFDAQGNQIK
jgi:hypothetical protein